MSNRTLTVRLVLRCLGVSLILAMIILAVVSGLSEPTTGSGEGANFMAVLATPVAAAYLVPGLVLIFRRQGHVVGWLLCLISFAFAVLFANGWGDRAVTPAFGIDPAWWLWVENWVMHGLFFAWLLGLVVLFPDGLAGRAPRHRAMGRALLAGISLLAFLAALGGELRVITDGPTIPSPFPIGVVPISVVEGSVVVSVLLVVISAFHLIVRSRAATSTIRLQHRWILFAIGLLASGFLVGAIMSEVTGNQAWWYPIFFGYLAVPLAIMMAILRFRLYEIDRIISRTVTYVLVVGCLGVLWAGLVIGIRGLFQIEGDVPVAVSTLAVALAFLPLVRQVQRLVDRRFFRSRYDAGVVMARVAEELRGSLHLEQVTSRAEAVVSEVFSPETLAVWVREVDR